jgi:hypothetical protein
MGMGSEPDLKNELAIKDLPGGYKNLLFCSNRANNTPLETAPRRAEN